MICEHFSLNISFEGFVGRPRFWCFELFWTRANSVFDCFYCAKRGDVKKQSKNGGRCSWDSTTQPWSELRTVLPVRYTSSRVWLAPQCLKSNRRWQNLKQNSHKHKSLREIEPRSSCKLPTSLATISSEIRCPKWQPSAYEL